LHIIELKKQIEKAETNLKCAEERLETEKTRLTQNVNSEILERNLRTKLEIQCKLEADERIYQITKEFEEKLFECQSNKAKHEHFIHENERSQSDLSYLKTKMEQQSLVSNMRFLH
jgi:hypothetical protein